MNNFFNGVKKAIDCVKKIKKQVEDIEAKGQENHFNEKKNESASERIERKDIKDFTIDSVTNRLSEKEEFRLHGTFFSYNKTNHSLVFKPDAHYNYGAMEVYFALFYKNLIPDMETLDTISFEQYEVVSNIVFQDWEYNPKNNPQSMQAKMGYLGINDPKVETINSNYLEYHIVGESNKVYVEKYLYKIPGKESDGITPYTFYLEISLFLYKEHINEEDKRTLLNEYHTIIDTLEWR